MEGKWKRIGADSAWPTGIPAYVWMRKQRADKDKRAQELHGHAGTTITTSTDKIEWYES